MTDTNLWSYPSDWVSDPGRVRSIASIASSASRPTGGVSTQLVKIGAELLPPGESAMQQIRAAMRAILEGAAADIPELAVALPRLLTLVGVSGRRGLLGSFAREQWELAGEMPLHQLLVSDTHLSDDVEEVADTVVHELAHLLASVRGERDTSNRGRYHSKRFKAVAEELGLLVAYRDPHGFCTVGLSPELRRRLGRELKELEAALVLRLREASSGVRPRGAEAPNADVNEKKKYVTAVCGCPKVFRMAVGYWEPDTIACDVCGAYFVDSECQLLGVTGSAGRPRSSRPKMASRPVVRFQATHTPISITTIRKEIQ